MIPLISMAIRRSGSVPLKFIPRITFKRDRELEIQGKLDDIFSKLKLEKEQSKF
jgi:ribosome-binding factor A